MASREVESIISFVKASGAAYKVTDINTPGVHAAKSFHYANGTGGVGLAVDFAGRTPGDLPAMKKIYDVLAAQAPMLAELIHNQPGVIRAVKNGNWASGMAVYGPTTWAAHTNHIHVAVHLGTFLIVPQARAAAAAPPTKKVFPMFDPPIDMPPVVADLACPTGGAWTLHTDGGIGGWAGALVTGSVVGKPYWLDGGKPRTPARLELSPDNRPITVATDGAKYGPEY